MQTEHQPCGITVRTRTTTCFNRDTVIYVGTSLGKLIILFHIVREFHDVCFLLLVSCQLLHGSFIGRNTLGKVRNVALVGITLRLSCIGSSGRSVECITNRCKLLRVTVDVGFKSTHIGLNSVDVLLQLLNTLGVLAHVNSHLYGAASRYPLTSITDVGCEWCRCTNTSHPAVMWVRVRLTQFLYGEEDAFVGSLDIGGFKPPIHFHVVADVNASGYLGLTTHRYIATDGNVTVYLCCLD